MADIAAKSVIKTPFREIINDNNSNTKKEYQSKNSEKHVEIINIQKNRQSLNYFISFDENWYPNNEKVNIID